MGEIYKGCTLIVRGDSIVALGEDGQEVASADSVARVKDLVNKVRNKAFTRMKVYVSKPYGAGVRLGTLTSLAAGQEGWISYLPDEDGTVHYPQRERTSLDFMYAPTKENEKIFDEIKDLLEEGRKLDEKRLELRRLLTPALAKE